MPDSNSASHRALAAQIRKMAGDRTISFVSGNFNVVHPGHLRLLNFAAECAEFLVVGVHDDSATDTFVIAELRLQGVQAIGVVDHAFLLAPETVVGLIRALEPEVVVKGKEHEARSNPEKEAIDAYGGRLIFSSGEVQFSSLDVLQREFRERNLSSIRKPTDFLVRQGIESSRLRSLVEAFAGLKVIVIGDLIIDEYVTCDPLGMSREDPTIVVTPIHTDRFVGGAGIVAAHARGLGAQVRFFSLANDDAALEFARQRLKEHGVESHFVLDGSRPTTLKQRFRAGGKTLLRVSHLRQHAIGEEQQGILRDRMIAELEDADLVIFSDFNYGCLPQPLVDEISAECARRSIRMAADSQASSQLSDISRFKNMQLITPTEHEARVSMRDSSSGLVILAESLRRQAGARNVIITMGAEGVLIQADRHGRHNMATDQLPAFNTAPKDVSGAGDSLLTCASMALSLEATIWEAAYLGSVAAACQVARIGNVPLSSSELLAELAE
jgi:rfaE bifunctional protein kinase chain/domain